MTLQKIYLRAIERLQRRLVWMERNLNGASLAVHEEFEELCLIVSLLEEVTQPQSTHTSVVPSQKFITSVGHTQAFPTNGSSVHLTTFPDLEESSLYAPKPIYAIIDMGSYPADSLVHDDRYLASVERFGGRILATPSHCEVINGEWHPRNVMIQCWETAEAFHRWYDAECLVERNGSPAVPLTSVVLIEGNEPL